MNKYGQPPALQTISLRMKNESFAAYLDLARASSSNTPPLSPSVLIAPSLPCSPSTRVTSHPKIILSTNSRPLPTKFSKRKELDVTSALFSRCGMRIDGAGDIHERVGIFFSVSFFFLFLEHK